MYNVFVSARVPVLGLALEGVLVLVQLPVVVLVFVLLLALALALLPVLLPPAMMPWFYLEGSFPVPRL